MCRLSLIQSYHMIPLGCTQDSHRGVKSKILRIKSEYFESDCHDGQGITTKKQVLITERHFR